MNASSHCLMCLMSRQEKQARAIASEDDRLRYLTRSMQIIADCAGKLPAPVIVEHLRPLNIEYFGEQDAYAEAKRKYNELMLSLEDSIAADIDSAEDSLRRALLYARAGNYIDFGTLSQVEESKLLELLRDAASDALDDGLYRALLDDLASAKRLVFLLDNCGEIVLDKLFLRELRRRYPDMHITAMTRGGYVLNDATADDAQSVGIGEYAHIVGNGTTVPGTWMPDVSIEACVLLQTADVVVSKGQANLETFFGNGINTYYLLLCKCQRFVETFGQDMYTGLFIHEKKA